MEYKQDKHEQEEQWRRQRKEWSESERGPK